MHGNHSNHVWRAQVGRPDHPGPAVPMVIKLLKEGKNALAIELACALAAQALKLPVPYPALVVAERDDLGALPISITGERLLLIGSHYKKTDALYTQMVSNNPAAEEFIWSRVCASPTGAKGAAWDELVANPDRHSENLLFDGIKWWLFDHDLALPSTDAYLKNDATNLTRTEAVTFQAKCNELASQMLTRHPNNHNIDLQAQDLSKHKTNLLAIATFARTWNSDDATVKDIFLITAILLDMIAMRLPILAQHLRARMLRPEAKSLWTSPSPSSPDRA